MKTNRFGFSADESADRTRYYRTIALMEARAVADLIGDIWESGQPISEADLEWFTAMLERMGTAIHLGSVGELDNDARTLDELERFWDTYSDGSAVSTVLGDLTKPEHGVPGDFVQYLPWCPNGSAVPAPVSSMGGTPAGAVILVADPPHQREQEGQPPSSALHPEGFTMDEIMELFYGTPSEELLRRALGGDTPNLDTGTDEGVISD